MGGAARLDGMVAIVTGSGQGAGRGVAEVLAADGAAVALVGRTRSKLDEVAAAVSAAGGRAHPITCDVGVREDIDAAIVETVDVLGRIDVLVNAAHHNVRDGALLEIDEADVELLWRTGPLATLRLMRGCHPHLARGGRGSIVNFGSGTQFAPQRYGVYAGAKDAIQALTRAAAVEWGGDGIRANLIVPLNESPSMRATISTPERRADSESRIPVGRFAEPADIGRAAAFLAGPDAAFVTGQVLMVDGGMMYHR